MRPRALLSLAVLLLVVGCASGPPAEPDISGRYRINTAIQGMSVSSTMRLTKGEDGYSGTIDAQEFGSFPVTGVTREGDAWMIRSDNMDGLLVIEMYLNGDQVNGTWTFAGDGGAFTGRRLE